MPFTKLDWNDTRFETRCIRADQDADLLTGSMVAPFYRTSTYRWNRVGVGIDCWKSRMARPGGVIRISVGIENGDDLVDDLASAIERVP